MRQKIEDLFRQSVINAVLPRSLHVRLALRHQDFMLLLAHGAAQDVRLPEREIREHLHDLHDLLLIEHDTERLLQDRLQERMQVGHFLLAVPARNEIRHHAAAQGARPVERDRRDEVLEVFRLQVLDEIRHARRFHLEDRTRIAAAEHLGCLLVLKRYRVDVDRDAAALLDVLQGVGDDRERAQAKEVHLQKAQLFHVILVVLRHERAVGDLHRHIVGQGISRDHDARRVRRRVARQPFKVAREVDEPLRLVALLIDAAKILRIGKRTVQRDAKLRRHSLCHAINARIRHFERTPDVANRALRRHRAEGDDLRDMISAVAALHIVDDLLAADVAEVDVDIGHRHALRIQKTLEEQFVLQGIEIRDAQEIGDDAARRRAAPGADGDALATRILDEIPNDEKVAVIAHAMDDGKLVVEPFAHGGRDLFVAKGQILLAELL